MFNGGWECVVLWILFDSMCIGIDNGIGGRWGRYW